MSDIEKIREDRDDLPSAAELSERRAAGWTLSAIEWVRAGSSADSSRRHEIPYGLQPSSDGRYLVANEAEMAMLRAFLRGMIDDRPLSEIAAALNDEGFRTRADRGWTQSALFDLLPRVVEAGAHILRSEEWKQSTGPRLVAL